MAAFVAGMALGQGTPAGEAATPPAGPLREGASAEPAWQIKEIRRAPPGLRVVSPDGKQYLINRKDAQGVYQVYVGNVGTGEATCISSPERPGGPKANRHKMQVNWHPSGKWIFLAAERDTYSKPLTEAAWLPMGFGAAMASRSRF